MSRPWSFGSSLILSLCLLVGLSTTLSAASATSSVESVAVRSRLDPNAILITEIDVVFVYDAALIDQIPDSKKAWYGNKRNITRKAGEGLDVVNLFIPQGFDSDRLSLPERRGEALQVIVFAYHDSADAKPIDITDLKNVLVEVDTFGIRVSAQ